MRVLIVESEIYLAQNIAAKLTDFGYSCDIVASVKDAIKDSSYDVVLVSTTMGGQNFLPVIERYKKSIVILMVTYVSHDSVNAPMRVGAKDYIMKPFMIEELVKKINHYAYHERLVAENFALRKLLVRAISDAKLPDTPKKNSWPLVVVSNNIKLIDAFVVELAKERNLSICYSTEPIKHIIDPMEIIYFGSFYALKPLEKEQFLAKLRVKGSQPHILASNAPLDGFATIAIKTPDKYFDGDEVLTIEEYTHLILERLGDKYPDVELAKKLGISRKSIWERRKKYGITKKK
jgi:CheY-like chemotaxis protein